MNIIKNHKLEKNILKKQNLVLNEGVVVALSNLSKQFKIPYEKKTTIFEKITGMFNKNHHEIFYALKDINLELKKGEFLGIIGQNGSGKSTLLRTIAHIIEPTQGTVFTKGKIVSFIDLGVGFQGELTAKENIYLYGAVIGLSRKEIIKKYDSIINFAGTKKFMDAKLKTFSSGMVVRLAFSTAIQTNPDILILDEIFAVGDKDFQNKCHKVLHRLKKKGTTIIFASHDLELISKVCTKSIYLSHGKILLQGNTDKIITQYLRDNHK